MSTLLGWLLRLSGWSRPAPWASRHLTDLFRRSGGAPRGSFTDLAGLALAAHIVDLCLALLGVGLVRWAGQEVPGAAREPDGRPDSPRAPPRWCPR